MDIDRKAKTVSANIFGLAHTKAIFRPGLGCTLVNEVDESEIRKLPALPIIARPASDSAALVWPRVSSKNMAIKTAIDKAFEEKDPKKPLRTRAVVVLQNGQLIAERYATGISAQTPLIGWSMTKSVTNAMIGLLVKDGKLDIHRPAPLVEWQADERKNISIDHLLRMSSGLDWDEDYSQPSPATEMLFRTKNAGQYALEVKAKYAPDEKWYYSSGSSNILQEIIRRQFKSAEAYLGFPHERLFRKIGMHSAIMEPDASGTYVGSSFMFATARDWAKFGQLYLQDGIWNGERLLPEGWVAYSAKETPHSDGQYAAHFWLFHKNNQYPADVFHAVGFEGQYVTIVPSKKLVIVRLGCTPGDNFDQSALVKAIIKAV